MAGSCCWSRAACLVALWAAVVSNADPKYVDDAKAKYHQTILLPCRTECHGPVIVDRWNIDINGVFQDFEHLHDKNIGKTKYIDNKNASLTIQNPEWEGMRWYRCYWSCQNQDSLNMYSDISIFLIKDVKTNNIIGAKVGEKISIPCRGNSESRITESVEWHFALPGQPYYPVNMVSGRKHSIDNNKSLLIHNLQKKDAGFYLCELKNVKDFYETKVNIIRGPSGVDLTPVYNRCLGGRVHSDRVRGCLLRPEAMEDRGPCHRSQSHCSHVDISMHHCRWHGGSDRGCQSSQLGPEQSFGVLWP
uniref:Uncharacterized protein LOC116955627 n=1 Tax=Petromyzon marinus TaxID=7757 RepID=A0AAJ7UA72_PETMA|nr:uncharacterized protein LOC116955627 [Petromyzon marinus]